MTEDYGAIDRKALEDASGLPYLEQCYVMLKWTAEQASDDPTWRNSPCWDKIVQLISEGK